MLHPPGPSPVVTKNTHSIGHASPSAFRVAAFGLVLVGSDKIAVVSAPFRVCHT
jgi:hypothetical protein